MTPRTIDNVDALLTPEGVPVHFRVAGVGVRMGAQIVDILVTGIAAAALVIFIATAGLAGPETLMAVASVTFFAIRIPYYIASELAWNGQTLGKRFLKIKVLSNDGGPLSTHALVLRNLMKEAEVFLPGTLVLTLDGERVVPSLLALAWITGTLAVPLLNKRRRRLGDFMAGTYVIHLPEPVLLKDLTEHSAEMAQGNKEFVFLSHHLDHYGAFELQTLEAVLRSSGGADARAPTGQKAANLALITDKIRTKIQYAQAIPPSQELRFLHAFYNAQRGHLEQKQLFGERRADKFHADNASKE